jgi:hypothetical protein
VSWTFGPFHQRAIVRSPEAIRQAVSDQFDHSWVEEALQRFTGPFFDFFVGHHFSASFCIGGIHEKQNAGAGQGRWRVHRTSAGRV